MYYMHFNAVLEKKGNKLKEQVVRDVVVNTCMWDWTVGDTAT